MSTSDMNEAIQRSFDRDAIRDVIMRLAHAQTAGTSDPVDDEESSAAVVALADLLGNVQSIDAAEGIASALLGLWYEREIL